ncbi:DUF4259 domain-containing protein [Streptomyces fagopyri]|uniref:DUF4259 domain-containing protein n=1 Tax=Streptomyces fagopyri TaxID=2662397 RepID=UPI0038060B0C
MGIWDIGPFGNDTAADFANALDDPEPGAGEAVIRGVLVRTVIATGCLGEADEAVSDAALAAARCPGDRPVVDTPYNREAPMPLFPSDLRTLADEALPRIAGDEAGWPRSGSTRRTGSSGRSYSHAFAQCLSRRPLPSRSSTPSHNEASLARMLTKNPRNGLRMFTASKSVQSAAAERPDCTREPTGRYPNYTC